MSPRVGHRSPGLVRLLVVFFLLVAACLLPACGRSAPEPPTAAERDASITVASFNFSESVLLGEIYATALAGAGFRVDRQLALGAREIVQPALEQGMVDLVPEYVGSALSFLDPDAPKEADAEPARAALQRAYAGRGVVVGAPSGAQDQNGFVVLRETADALGLESLGDLAPIAGDLTFGGPPECPRRPLCLPGLAEVYEVEFGAVEALDSGGPLTVAALRSGRIDVGLLFTTGGNLGDGALVLLEDDLGLQPAEHVVPVVRAAVLDRHGEDVLRVIEEVQERLDVATLIALNHRLDRGEAPADVAAGWLAATGLR